MLCKPNSFYQIEFAPSFYHNLQALNLWIILNKGLPPLSVNHTRINDVLVSSSHVMFSCQSIPLLLKCDSFAIHSIQYKLQLGIESYLHIAQQINSQSTCIQCKSRQPKSSTLQRLVGLIALSTTPVLTPYWHGPLQSLVGLASLPTTTSSVHFTVSIS